ncbi:response regulator transcription factor [Vogesella urethralis]|jgi:RNA polymerase sigma factor (sigma-70 family)|uniref:response regulator transcription factor n=1 Tax=Vogesella urethralis TaxID=2592656 RepID=UPI0011847984|nr:response regulator [Vogesella urethralis]MEC5207602.1 two-component system response regulator FixJ [Vogesella perlucida]
MASMTPTIFVIDDDPAVRDSLALLIGTQGLRVQTFEHAEAFLQHFRPDEIGCLVLDIRMPQTSGLALQDMLNLQNIQMPIIFVTGHGDLEECRRAFRGGAVDFLTKPVNSVQLLESLKKAIRISIQQQKQEAETQEVRQKLERITERERMILRYVAEGRSSKEIARELDLSPRTVEAHRAKLFEKLEINSLAELVRFYLKALDAAPPAQPN